MRQAWGTPRYRVLAQPRDCDASARSSPDGVVTSIRWTNATEVPFEVAWIDAEGEGHARGTVAAGETTEIESIAGHVFAVSAAGRCLAHYVADERPTSVAL